MSSDALAGIATHTYQLYIKKNSNKINLDNYIEFRKKSVW